MPGLLYSGAIMGVVAYGEVVGANGSSPAQNSGHYATARTSTGVYTLTPTSFGDIQTEALSQCLVQLKTGAAVARTATVSTNVSTPPTGVITVRILNADEDPSDSDFSFVVLRSTISPPPGEPA